MKKIIYLFAVLFALAACTEDFNKDVAPPQSHPQQTEQSVDGFTFKLGDAFLSPIVLTEEKINSESDVAVIINTATPTLPDGATVTYKILLSDTEDFAKSVLMGTTNKDNSAVTTYSDLNERVKELYGKAPYERALYLKVAYYIMDSDGNSSLMPTALTFGPILITPVAPVIETEYYLVGGTNGWDITNLDGFKFSHPGGDVYENSTFTMLVNVPADCYFKIVPKSSKEAASWDGLLGTAVDGDESLTGTLVVDGNAMKIAPAGWVRITLNMMEYTYSIEIIGDINLTLYVPGSHQGWSPATAPTLYSRSLDAKYEGYVNFSAGDMFKFTSQPNWDGTNYGDSGTPGVLSTDGGAGNLTVTEAGYYKIDVDLSGNPYTYILTKTDWGLIGSATAGGWDNSTPMTYDAATKTLSVTTALTAGEFKFRANNGWDINLGGNVDNLSYGGNNITISEAGTYMITLDLSDPTVYKATVVKL